MGCLVDSWLYKPKTLKRDLAKIYDIKVIIMKVVIENMKVYEIIQGDFIKFLGPLRTPALKKHGNVGCLGG